MSAARTNTAKLMSRRRLPGLAADIADLLRSLAQALFDPYRPERHYMRGPGPRWRAKHALVRTRARY